LKQNGSFVKHDPLWAAELTPDQVMPAYLVESAR
jgi:hypothetical protein